MSKSIEKTNTGSIVAAQTAGPIMQGIDSSDFVIPVAWLFQDTATERREYPGNDAGQIVSRLTGSVVPSNRFVVLKVWKSWVRFDDKTGEVIYNTTNPREVPAGETEWTEDEKGNSVAPLAIETYNFILLFEGMEDLPHVFRFKRTSLKEGKKLLTLAQYVRGKMFEFGPPATGQNAKKETYLIPTVKASADPVHPAMAEQMQRFIEMETQGRVKVEDEVPF